MEFEEVPVPSLDLVFRFPKLPELEVSTSENEELNSDVLLGDDAIEESNAARREVVRILEECELPSQLAAPAITALTEKLSKLAYRLDILAKRSSKCYLQSILSYLPFHVLRGILIVLFSESDVQKLLGNPPKKEAFPKKYFRLCVSIMENLSDIVNQSFLRQMQSVMRTVSTPQSFETKVFPAIPVFTSNGKSDARFTRRKLDATELSHPIITGENNSGPTDYSQEDVGRCSVISDLARFKRSFKIFTMGLTEKVDLGVDKAVITGGSVTACLMPWPEHIEELYNTEQGIALTLQRYFVRTGIPLEIRLRILQFIGMAGYKLKTDRALFQHYHAPSYKSGFEGSDVDVFVVSKQSTLENATERIPLLYRQLLRNRQKPPVEIDKLLPSQKHLRGKITTHWTRYVEDVREPEEYYWTENAEKHANGDYTDNEDEDDDDEDDEDESKSSGSVSSDSKVSSYETNEFGWTKFRKRTVALTYKFLPTVRTNNSITICGLHPMRHIQIMLPGIFSQFQHSNVSNQCLNAVVHSPEEFQLSFDLDCVAVFWDGTNVYASERAIRAYNTRTNFVTLSDTRDKARVSRMCKYAMRGFQTLIFEVCRHRPRCDVKISKDNLDAIIRNFRDKTKKFTVLGRDGIEEQILVKYEEELQDEQYHFAYKFLVMGGADEEPPVALLKSNYTPVPLLYGPDVTYRDILTQMETFENPEDKTEWFIKTPPLISRLPHRITSNPVSFVKEISQPASNNPMHFGVRWKAVKDTQRYRWVWWGVAAETCYMCKGLLPKTRKQKKIDEISDEEDSDEESESSESDVQMADTISNQLQHRKIGLCDSCNELNTRKKDQGYDMTGKNCIVTGGRTKIGYEVAVKLLRCNANVLITTRFPLLAVAKFKEERDCELWIHRLQVCGVDFRDMKQVVAWVSSVKSKWNTVDVLINNAAQTIRRPPAYYSKMVEEEINLSSRKDLQNHVILITPGAENQTLPPPPGILTADSSSSTAVIPSFASNTSEVINGLAEKLSLSNRAKDVAPSALLTQMPFPGDEGSELFSHEGSVIKTEPVDKREKTSWTSQLDSVHMMEVAEALLINTFVPTMLLQQFEPLLTKPPHNYPRFIVNVTSPEGNFSSASSLLAESDYGTVTSDGVHPHTNMAKAALNKLTVTIAEQFATKGCYVTAVDPGWVSSMTPTPETTQVGVARPVIPPLTEEDGAARILDPIFTGLNGDVLLKGVLLKDFKIISW
ncbi:hypothetical protein HK098_002250 [Nowakowskiella sp. JEL0407]|nr:hypothetical protein HK098_002250 [Nowakowskiella sp. JEL0407]